MAKRRTDQKWRTLFEQFESSQLSKRVFCERTWIGLSTFYDKHQQLTRIQKPEYWRLS